MWEVSQAELPIIDRSGRERGRIRIELLPDDPATPVPPLLDRRRDPELEPGMPGVQLLESHEYGYEIAPGPDAPPGNISTDRPEIFQRDKVHGRTGRIRTGLYTGTLPVNVYVDRQVLGFFEVEVRARKLDYLTHYRWMLRDLADVFTEVIMRRFAPAETHFSLRWNGEAPTLYQRFAFLRSILEDDTLETALIQIFSNPHREWREELELRESGRPIPSGPAVARSVTRSGPRVPWRSTGAHTLTSLPACIPVKRYFETLDTPPNRFVKHVLTQWRNMAADIERSLEGAPATGPVRRGLAEARGVLARLDEILAQPLFRQVSPLTQAPLGNQVLQKRVGYRDVYKLYVQSELAAMLAWSGGEDVYRAGQKDVATLYEYWVFVQLALIVSEHCQEPLDLERLVEKGNDGLDLQLKRGIQRVLKGTITRKGRTLELELWYNKTFPKDGRDGSWTRHLRPDCSLRITVPGYGGTKDEQWLHFDAKYRLDSLLEIFGREQNVEDEEPAPANLPASDASPAGKPITEDLLKMHAYRDAIRRSSGAFVIYPGNEPHLLRQYHEILPGLGAFALRPTASGSADGAVAVRRFIVDVLDHAATQASQHERYRYWRAEVFKSAPPAGTAKVQAVSFLSRPPADTRVLLGYVRTVAQYRWIQETHLYNLRADERKGSVGLHSEQLAAELVVLYAPDLERTSLWRVTGYPQLLSRERMLELGYPHPGGTVYFCLPVEPLDEGTDVVSRLTFRLVAQLAKEIAPDADDGAPIATTWDRLTGFLAARAATGR